MHFCTHCEFQGIGCLGSIELEVFEVREVSGGPTGPGSKPHVLFDLGVGIHVEGVVAHAVAHLIQELAEMSLRASKRYLARQPREEET